MAKSQFRSIRKVSGKKYLLGRKIRSSDLGGDIAETNIGNKRVKVKRVMGGNIKRQLLSNNVVYVNSNGKIEKLEIEGVEENPANSNYTRRNIITKGTIIKTKKGNVKITSRPGQVSQLQGIFIK
jgi:small subunit ribosomal protein S8e